MPLLLDTGRGGKATALRGRNTLTIGLVNNMPEAARDATERQFIDLIRAVTGDTVVCLKLFAIGDARYANGMTRERAGRYRDIADLWDMPLDGLIVTGNEPQAPDLRDEAYWPALAKLVDWAGDNTASTIWSCLAAHAAVLHADGIERSALADKLSGVFAGEAADNHALLTGVASPLQVPHSRLNDLSEAALASCGYRVLTRSAAAGVDAFVRQAPASSLFVFFQGHPEYDTDSLLREYRRDAGRFLRGERDTYPAMPRNYFNADAARSAEAFRDRAVAERDASLFAAFPMHALADGIRNSWRDAALALYRNWIAYLKDHKTGLRAGTSPARLTTGDARSASAG
jgi:homoserine O-succinyltransferase/O-acetyltransferase